MIQRATLVDFKPRDLKLVPSYIDSLHAGTKSNNGQQSQLFHMTGILQTTLDLNELLRLFFHYVRKQVTFESIAFSNKEQQFEIKLGREWNHTCRFQIVLHKRTLGNLCFGRNIAFNKHEKTQLEYFIGSLVYPLRNALLYDKAQEEAKKDPLTGIQNRAALNDSLKREISLAHRHKKPLSIIVLDIDHFKHINDSFGHATGDLILKSMVSCIKKCIRETDLFFRYGGEEFVVILPNTDQTGAKLLAERMRRNIEDLQFKAKDLIVKMTISAGVASLICGDDDKNLFSKADDAMYCAKSEGRNKVILAN